MSGHRDLSVKAALSVLSVVLVFSALLASMPVRAQQPPAERSAARLTPGQPIPRAELEAFIDGYVAGPMKNDHIAGLTLAVVQGEQPVILKGYGIARAGKEPVTVDPRRTRFRIGSISKTFTWLLLAQEITDGRLRLDDPLNEHLPPRLRLADDGFDTPVLVRDLPAHSAGFEDLTFGHMLARTPSDIPTLSQYLVSHRPRRVRPPGLISSYSNYGAVLAGALVVETSGAQDFQTLVETRLLYPLGMRATSFREPYLMQRRLPSALPRELAAETSDGFRWRDGHLTSERFEFLTGVAPAGSATSTAEDMAIYMQALLKTGVPGISSGSLTSSTLFQPSTRRAGATNRWPLGFVSQSRSGFETFGHNGETLNFSSNMELAPALDLGIFISGNTESSRSLAGALPAEIIRHFYGTASNPDTRLEPRDLGQYEGTYTGTRRTYSGVAGFIGLLTSQATISTVDGRILQVSNLGRFQITDIPDRFNAVSGDGFIEFQRDPRQRIISWATEANAVSFERTPLDQQMVAFVVCAGIALALSVLTLFSSLMRLGSRRDSSLLGADVCENLSSMSFLTSAGFFVAWVVKAEDAHKVLYVWPDPLLVTASLFAFVGMMITLAMIPTLPIVWKERSPWTVVRKASFSLNTLAFSVFSIFIALWGGFMFWE